VAAATAIQMKASWKTYAHTPVRGVKKTPNAASAMNASDPPTQIGFDTQ